MRTLRRPGLVGSGLESGECRVLLRQSIPIPGSGAIDGGLAMRAPEAAPDQHKGLGLEFVRFSAAEAVRGALNAGLGAEAGPPAGFREGLQLGQGPGPVLIFANKKYV